MTQSTSRRAGRVRAALWLAMLIVPLLAACTTTPPAVNIATPNPTAVSTAATRSPAQVCAAARRSADPMLLRVVDKQRGLPSDYAPTDLLRVEDRLSVPGFEGARLRREAAEALVTLLSAGKTAGYDLRIKSGYRSYAEQVTTFQYWVNLHGEAMAKRESAPAGHSEHQLGSTADLTSATVNWDLEEPFGRTPEAKWLAAHVHEFGFALSYPQDAEAITGYVWEPWHLRYLGRECAAAWRQSGTVLVRFLEAVAASPQ